MSEMHSNYARQHQRICSKQRFCCLGCVSSLTGFLKQRLPAVSELRRRNVNEGQVRNSVTQLSWQPTLVQLLGCSLEEDFASAHERFQFSLTTFSRLFQCRFFPLREISQCAFSPRRGHAGLLAAVSLLQVCWCLWLLLRLPLQNKIKKTKIKYVCFRFK